MCAFVGASHLVHAWLEKHPAELVFFAAVSRGQHQQRSYVSLLFSKKSACKSCSCLNSCRLYNHENSGLKDDISHGTLLRPCVRT